MYTSRVQLHILHTDAKLVLARQIILDTDWPYKEKSYNWKGVLSLLVEPSQGLTKYATFQDGTNFKDWLKSDPKFSKLIETLKVPVLAFDLLHVEFVPKGEEILQGKEARIDPTKQLLLIQRNLQDSQMADQALLAFAEYGKALHDSGVLNPEELQKQAMDPNLDGPWQKELQLKMGWVVQYEGTEREFDERQEAVDFYFTHPTASFPKYSPKKAKVATSPDKQATQPNTTWDGNEPFSPLPTQWELHTNPENLGPNYSKRYFGLKDGPYWTNEDQVLRLVLDQFSPISQAHLKIIQRDSSSILLKLSTAYSDAEMEELYMKVRQDDPENYESSSDGGFVPHDWNDDSSDYPKPKDLDKSHTRLDQLVPPSRRFRQRVTPWRPDQTDFLSEPADSGDIAKWALTPYETGITVVADSDSDPIDLARVEMTDASDDLGELNGNVFALQRKIPWKAVAKKDSFDSRVKLYEVQIPEIEALINKLNYTEPFKRKQIQRVKELIYTNIREKLRWQQTREPKSVYVALPSSDDLNTMFDSLPRVRWTKESPVRTTMQMDDVSDLLLRHKFDPHFFTSNPRGETGRYRWSKSPTTLLVYKLA